MVNMFFCVMKPLNVLLHATPEVVYCLHTSILNYSKFWLHFEVEMLCFTLF